MLFHLFSQHANGYVTFPTNVGPFTISTQPGPGTVMDLCRDNGSTIDRGARYSNDPSRANEFDVDAGSGTLNSDDRVTVRNPANKYMTPRDQRLTVDAPFAGHAHFKMKKLSGSPGARIRHGDLVALGAYQPYDPSRSPNTQRLRWLEANPDDNDPGTDPVKLGGLSMNPGGDSQRFRFFEANSASGRSQVEHDGSQSASRDRGLRIAEDPARARGLAQQVARPRALHIGGRRRLHVRRQRDDGDAHR